MVPMQKKHRVWEPGSRRRSRSEYQHFVTKNLRFDVVKGLTDFNTVISANNVGRTITMTANYQHHPGDGTIMVTSLGNPADEMYVSAYRLMMSSSLAMATVAITRETVNMEFPASSVNPLCGRHVSATSKSERCCGNQRDVFHDPRSNLTSQLMG